MRRETFERHAANANQIRQRWEELKSVTEGFVACCENGNFNPLRGIVAENKNADGLGRRRLE